MLLPLAAILFAACDDPSEDPAVDPFEPPRDAALVCYDPDADTPLPLSCCNNDVTLDEAPCDFGFSTAKLYAFVTQPLKGEVAVVDLEEQLVLTNPQDPYGSFIPVGSDPNDIVASEDGRRVYTANRETGDVSVIETVREKNGRSVIDTPYLNPAGTIDVEGDAARIVLVKRPEAYKDRVALVTQPRLGRLAVVALDAESCTDAKESAKGCLKGYLPLTLPDSEDPVEPYAISDGDGDLIYVGSHTTSVLFSVRLGPLVETAMAMDTPDEISPETGLDEVIPLGNSPENAYRVRTLSIEPTKRRWLYGIDADAGKVIAMDLSTRTPGSGDPIAPRGVAFGSGVARSVRLLELGETDEADPYTFNGTFAVVATTKALLAVIDIEDLNQDFVYFRPHRMRSTVDLSSPDGIPAIGNTVLSLNGETVPREDVDDYFQLVEEDAGPGCDAGVSYKAEYDKGIRFHCDPYNSSRRTWDITWEGQIGLTGSGIVTNITESDGDIYRLLHEDRRTNFCEHELYPKDAVPGYPGDRLIITSAPTPIDGEEALCEEAYPKKDGAPLEYRIVGVSKYEETDENPNVIEFEKLREDTPDLLPECFGQLLTFEVRATGHWTINPRGGSSPQRTGAFVPEERTCRYDNAGPSTLRVYEGERFQNNQFLFKIVYGEAWRNGPFTPIPEGDTDRDTDVSAVYSLPVKGGYEEMYRAIGGMDITDIEVTPESDLIMVDQAGEGIIVFDLIDQFNTIGRHIF